MNARCECCKGRRELLGLGGMVKKCLSCNGIGWKAVVDVVVDTVVSEPRVREEESVSVVGMGKRVREFRDNKKQKRG